MLYKKNEDSGLSIHRRKIQLQYFILYISEQTLAHKNATFASTGKNDA